MNRGNLKPIIASITVAGILYAFFWWMAGDQVFSSYSDPTSRLTLFFHQFMPALIAIAVSAGIVSGAIPGSGRLNEPSLRGALAAVLFGIIAFPFTIMVLGPSPDTSHTSTPAIFVVLLYGIMILILGLFGAIGSVFYAVFAALGALLGEWLCGKSKILAIITILSVCAVSIQIFRFSR